MNIDQLSCREGRKSVSRASTEISTNCDSVKTMSIIDIKTATAVLVGANQSGPDFWQRARARATSPDNRIPLPVKLGFTAFMAVLIPVYWTHYGPTNFLYFCDLALLLTLAGIWLEKPLLVSMPAAGILAPQVLWIADFILNIFGIPLTGMTDYMFEASSPLYLRGLSMFHGWLPVMLIYCVAKLGYDKRGFWSWTALAWVAMVIAYFLLPGPSPEMAGQVANVNYVFGMGSTEPQTWMPGWAWFVSLLIGIPAILVFPMHKLLQWVFPDQRQPNRI
jgi:hypothetical protein